MQADGPVIVVVTVTAAAIEPSVIIAIADSTVPVSKGAFPARLNSLTVAISNNRLATSLDLALTGLTASLGLALANAST
jgi:hypothetical protein